MQFAPRRGAWWTGCQSEALPCMCTGCHSQSTAHGRGSGGRLHACREDKVDEAGSKADKYGKKAERKAENAESEGKGLVDKVTNKAEKAGDKVQNKADKVRPHSEQACSHGNLAVRGQLCSIATLLDVVTDLQTCLPSLG